MDKKVLAENAIEIAGKTALSVIPVGGTLITCVWDAVKGNAAQKRLNDWKGKVEERLSMLECTLEEIGNNEMFTSTIMKATDNNDGMLNTSSMNGTMTGNGMVASRTTDLGNSFIGFITN